MWTKYKDGEELGGRTEYGEILEDYQYDGKARLTLIKGKPPFSIRFEIFGMLEQHTFVPTMERSQMYLKTLMKELEEVCNLNLSPERDADIIEKWINYFMENW